MPDGCDLERGHAAFPFGGSQTPVLLQDIQRGLSRAWHLMLASQIDDALTALEAIERPLEGLPPSVATRYRAASHLVRSAVLAFQDDSLAVLAIVISQVFVEGGAGLGALLTGILRPDRNVRAGRRARPESTVPGSPIPTATRLRPGSATCSRELAKAIPTSALREASKSRRKRSNRTSSTSSRSSTSPRAAEAVSRAVLLGLL